MADICWKLGWELCILQSITLCNYLPKLTGFGHPPPFLMIGKHE